MADIRKQLLAAFEVEYREHVDAIRAALSHAREGAGVNVREIFRRAHSLKGAARAVDLPEIEEAAHAMETLFADVMERGGTAGAMLAERTAPHLATIERHADTVYARNVPEAEVKAAQGDLATPEFVRIDAARLQLLSVAAHELSGVLERMDADAEDLSGLQARADALARMLEAPGRNEDRGRLAQEARAIARGLRAATRAHLETSRGSLVAAGRLREEIERVALVPASTVFAGLETMLLDLAEGAGKRIDIKIEGLETQADRRLLQALRDPVLHLLRNAVVHGIETPIDRHSVGKPERGQIGVSITAHAGRLDLTVWDDGRGPDLRRIEDVAVKRALLPPRAERDTAPTVERLLALVFEPGFSTAGEVDRVAGRGMGLSVVAEAARRAGGGAFMRRRTPFGAEVLISTPLSASRQPVLLVNQGGQLYGLPTRALEQVIRAAPDTLEVLDGQPVVRLSQGGNQIAVPVVSLDLVTGVAAMAGTDSDRASIAILRLGDQRLGVQVHALREVREATVAALNNADVDELVQGAVQLEHDEVAIVVNPEALLRRHARSELGRALTVVRPVAVTRQRTILVVDDSVTTRTLEKSILEANGFRVVLAVDGVDALERLRTMDTAADLVVADVEMPRMDGFGLLGAIKADDRLAKIPVIMMTSRASPDDIQRGMELGADAYLVKQTFEQRELLETIGQLI
jgi:two-component system chemotaxis sensor kinase CheA